MGGLGGKCPGIRNDRVEGLVYGMLVVSARKVDARYKGLLMP